MNYVMHLGQKLIHILPEKGSFSKIKRKMRGVPPPKKLKQDKTYTNILINTWTQLKTSIYQVGIMSGNQTRPKCFETSQWISSSP